MDNIFLLINCIFIYGDDVLIFFKTEELHNKDLKQGPEILQKNNLKSLWVSVNIFRTNLEH